MNKENVNIASKICLYFTEIIQESKIDDCVSIINGIEFMQDLMMNIEMCYERIRSEIYPINHKFLVTQDTTNETKSDTKIIGNGVEVSQESLDEYYAQYIKKIKPKTLKNDIQELYQNMKNLIRDFKYSDKNLSLNDMRTLIADDFMRNFLIYVLKNYDKITTYF